MKKIILIFLCGLITINVQAKLVLVSGKSTQKNYIDTSSIITQHNPKTVIYQQLNFFDQDFKIESYRNSIAVDTNKMNCDKKTWQTLSTVRKSWDQQHVIDVLQKEASAERAIVNSGPVKFIYDHYCH